MGDFVEKGKRRTTIAVSGAPLITATGRSQYLVNQKQACDYKVSSIPLVTI